MPSKRKPTDTPVLTRQWSLPAAATLGSSVRAKGILLEVRARMPSPLKKALDLVAGELVLTMPETAAEEFREIAALVSGTLVGIENLPVIPREIEDILSIKTTERHRWLKDGRLPSAGTRTVKLRGRARQITFHVFDPHVVEDILDGDRVSAWREEDAETAAENRRRAAWNRRLARTAPADSAAPPPAEVAADEGPRPKLLGWAEFERLGLLR